MGHADMECNNQPYPSIYETALNGFVFRLFESTRKHAFWNKFFPYIFNGADKVVRSEVSVALVVHQLFRRWWWVAICFAYINLLLIELCGTTTVSSD